MYHVLIFPAGSEIGLEINNALKYSKFITVFGATSEDDHSRYVYENYISNLAYVGDKKLIEQLNEIIERYKIDFIYPAHDSAVLYFTEQEAELNAKVITSPLETVDVCRSKVKTYTYLKDQYFVPKTYQGPEEITEYPVFIKPAVGQGAQGAKKIESRRDLIHELERGEKKELVICEYLPGEEYTIDCFTDRKGALRVSKIRDRRRIRNGISVCSGVLGIDEEVQEIASILNKRFQFNGAWFFQLKKNKRGEYRLLEISPRIPGTMGVSRNLGINFPLLTIYNHLGYDIDVLENTYSIEVDRALISRYRVDIDYNTVYVDLDDTLILKGQVNSFLMMYLYQLSNQDKKIILLTKHAKEPLETLKTYRISSELFQRIIHISQEEKKSDYIREKSAILIDDSYAERKEVLDRLGIPVFDLDEIEALYDWRM